MTRPLILGIKEARNLFSGQTTDSFEERGVVLKLVFSLFPVSNILLIIFLEKSISSYLYKVFLLKNIAYIFGYVKFLLQIPLKE